MELRLPKVLYIAGIGRSGSTLLARALGGCERVFAAGEMMHLFGRGTRAIEACGCGSPASRCAIWGAVTRALRSDLGDAEPARLDALRRRMLEGYQLPALFAPWQPPRMRRHLQRLERAIVRTYGLVGALTGCHLVIDSSKNPGYGRILSRIPELELYVVHLIRDSRGVAYSLEKKKRRPGTPQEEYLDHHRAAIGALFWSGAHVLVERLAKSATGYMQVRYCDFVRAPAATLRRVLTMAGEFRGATQLSHIHDGELVLQRQHCLAGNDSRSPTGSVPLREDIEWRQEMSAAKRGVVTALTGPLLRRYGFSLG